MTPATTLSPAHAVNTLTNGAPCAVADGDVA